jgi:ATP-dependent Lon protease
MANKEDLFGFGTLAKISGVQGRVQGGLALVVEGLARFKIAEVTQETPYFEAKVDQYHNEGMIHAVTT